MESKNYTIGLIILGVAATMCLFGCAYSEPSPLDTEGVRRITPRGRAWSHVSGISWSPDGTELALTWMIGGSDLIPEGYVYTIDVEGHEPRKLTHTEADGGVGSPAWSPTANQIAFSTDGWDPAGIWLVDTSDEGTPRFLREGRNCAWAPDGERIAIANATRMDYTIHILNTRTGEQRQVFHLSEEQRYVLTAGLSWSPTGDRLAFSIDLDDHNNSTPPEVDIYVLDLVSGASRRLTQDGWNEFPSWSPDGTMIAFSGGERWQERTLVIVRVDDGSIIRPLDAVGVGPVAWSPDGSLIAFEWRGAVYVIEVAVALSEGFPDTGSP